VLLLAFKLVLAPLLMVGLAKALDLKGATSRAAVLVATLPISSASFSLGERYGIGQGVLSACVAAGTALMLPTVIVWVEVLDRLDLFKVPAVPAGAPGAVTAVGG
jgi:predicted permease